MLHLDWQYSMPAWMRDRNIVDDELEDELAQWRSRPTISSWEVTAVDGCVLGQLKAVIRVVDVSCDSDPTLGRSTELTEGSRPREE